MGQHFTVSMGSAKRRICTPGEEYSSFTRSEWFQYEFESHFNSKLHTDPAAYRDSNLKQVIMGVGASSSTHNTTYVTGREKNSATNGPLNILEISATDGSSGVIGTFPMDTSAMNYLLNTKPDMPYDAFVIDCMWSYNAQLKLEDGTYQDQGASSATVYLKMLSMRTGGTVKCLVTPDLNITESLGRAPNSSEIDTGMDDTALGYRSVSVNPVSQSGEDNYIGVPLKSLAASAQVLHIWCYDSRAPSHTWPDSIEGMNVTMPTEVTTFRTIPSYLWGGGGRFQVEIINGATLDNRKVRLESSPDFCDKPYDFLTNVNVERASNLSSEIIVPREQLFGYICYYETENSFGIPILTAPPIIFANSPPSWAADPFTSATFDPSIDTVIYWGVRSSFFVLNGNPSQSQMVSLLNYTEYDLDDKSCGAREDEDPDSIIRLSVPNSAIVKNGMPVSGMNDNVRLQHALGVYAVCYLGDTSDIAIGRDPIFAPLTPVKVWVGGPLATDNYWNQFAQTHVNVDLVGKALDGTNNITIVKVDAPCYLGESEAEVVYQQLPSEPLDSGDILRTGLVVDTAGRYKYCWFGIEVGRLDVWGPFADMEFSTTSGITNRFVFPGNYPVIGTLDSAVSALFGSGVVIVGYRDECGARLSQWHPQVSARSKPLKPDLLSADSDSGVISQLTFSGIKMSFPGIYRMCWAPEASYLDYTRFNTSVAIINVGGPLTGFTWTVLGTQDVTISVIGWSIPETARILFVDPDHKCGSGRMINNVNWPDGGWDQGPEIELVPRTNLSLELLDTAEPYERPDLQEVTFPTFNIYVFPGQLRNYRVCYAPSGVDRLNDFSLYTIEVGVVSVTTEVLCGDGLTSRPQEECDDGVIPPRGGDGCDEKCQIEPGWEPAPLSGTGKDSGQVKVQPICGDSFLVGYEWDAGRCDDGNLEDGDGCSKDCTVERGYECFGEPSQCESKCGDGIILDEDCDDGNILSGDGCSGSCTIEINWLCNNTMISPTGPSVCTEKPKPPAGPCPGQAVAPKGMLVCDFTTQPDSTLPLICEEQVPCDTVLTSALVSEERRTVVGCPLSDFEGLGMQGPVFFCHSPEPPKLVSGRFTPSGKQLRISFDTPVVTQSRETELPCGDLFSPDSLVLLGVDPGCAITEKGLFLDVFLGRDSTIVPGASIQLLRESLGLDISAYAEVPDNVDVALMELIPLVSGEFVPRRPSGGFTGSELVIETVASWNPCAGNLNLDALKGSTLLDQNSEITWSCDVSPMGPDHAAFVTEWLQRPRKDPFGLQFQVESVMISRPPPIGWVSPLTGIALDEEARAEMIDSLISLQLQSEAQYCFTLNVTSVAFSEQKLETICVPTLAGGSAPPLQVLDAPSGEDSIPVSESVFSSIGVGVDLGSALATGGEEGGLATELQRQCAKFTTSLVVYRWRLFKDDGLVEIPSVLWQSKFLTKRPNAVRIPPYSLLPGQYKWIVEAYYETGTQVSSIEIVFSLSKVSPISRINGLTQEGHRLVEPFPQISTACPLTFDASKSSLPGLDESSDIVSIGKWTYEWRCSSTDKQSGNWKPRARKWCPFGSIDNGIANDTTLVYKPYELSTLDMISIELTASVIVTWSSVLSGGGTDKVFLLKSTTPVVMIARLLEGALPIVDVPDSPPTIAPYGITVPLLANIDQLSFTVTRGCNITVDISLYTLQWQIDGELISPPGDLGTTANVSFPVELKGHDYQVELVVSTESFSAVVRSWVMRSTRPPFGGTLDVEFTFGTALTTTFVASAVGWTMADPDIQKPLSYEISAKRIGPCLPDFDNSLAALNVSANASLNVMGTDAKQNLLDSLFDQYNTDSVLELPGRLAVVHSFNSPGPTGRFVLNPGVWILLLRVKDKLGVQADGAWPLSSPSEDALCVTNLTVTPPQATTLLGGFTASATDSFSLIGKVGQVSDALGQLEQSGQTSGLEESAMALLASTRTAMDINTENPEDSANLINEAADIMLAVTSPNSSLAADANFRANGLETLNSLVALDTAQLGDKKQYFDIITNLADNNTQPVQLEGLRKVTQTITSKLLEGADRKNPRAVEVISKKLGIAANIPTGAQYSLMGVDFVPPGHGSTPPGQGGVAPGQNGANPGQGGSAPGQRNGRRLQTADEPLIAEVWNVAPYYDPGREVFRDGAVVVIKNLATDDQVPITVPLLPTPNSDLSDQVSCMNWEGETGNSTELDSRPTVEKRWVGWSIGKCRSSTSSVTTATCNCLPGGMTGVAPFKGLKSYNRYSPVVRLAPSRPPWPVFQAGVLLLLVGCGIACIALVLVAAPIWSPFIPKEVRQWRVVAFILPKDIENNKGIWAPWSLPRFALAAKWWPSISDYGHGVMGGIGPALKWALQFAGWPVVDRQEGSDFRRWSIQLMRLAWADPDTVCHNVFIFKVARALYMWHRCTGRFGKGTDEDSLIMPVAPLLLTKPKRLLKLKRQAQQLNVLDITKKTNDDASSDASSGSFGSMPAVPFNDRGKTTFEATRWESEDDVPPLLIEFVCWAWISNANSEGMVLGKLVATSRGLAFVPDTEFDYYQEDVDVEEASKGERKKWRHPTALLELPYNSLIAADPIPAYSAQVNLGDTSKPHSKPSAKNFPRRTSTIIPEEDGFKKASRSDSRRKSINLELAAELAYMDESVSEESGEKADGGNRGQEYEESPAMIMLYFDTKLSAEPAKRDPPHRMTTYVPHTEFCQGMYPSRAKSMPFPGIITSVDVPDSLGSHVPDSTWLLKTNLVSAPAAVKRQMKNSVQRTVRRVNEFRDGQATFGVVPDFRLLPEDLSTDPRAIEALSSRATGNTSVAMLLFDTWQDATTVLQALVEGRKRGYAIGPLKGNWVLPPPGPDGMPLPSVPEAEDADDDSSSEAEEEFALPKSFDVTYEGVERRVVLSKLGLMFHPTLGRPGRNSIDWGAPPPPPNHKPPDGIPVLDNLPIVRSSPNAPGQAAPIMQTQAGLGRKPNETGKRRKKIRKPQIKLAPSKAVTELAKDVADPDELHISDIDISSDSDEEEDESQDEENDETASYSLKSSIHDLVRSQSLVSSSVPGVESLFIPLSHVIDCIYMREDDGGDALQISYVTQNAEDGDREAHLIFSDFDTLEFVKMYLDKVMNEPQSRQVVFNGPAPDSAFSPPARKAAQVMASGKMLKALEYEMGSEPGNAPGGRRSSIMSMSSDLLQRIIDGGLEADPSGEEIYDMNKYLRAQLKSYAIREGTTKSMQSFTQAFVRLHPLLSHIRGIPEYALGACSMFFTVQFLTALPLMMRPQCVYGELVEAWANIGMFYYTDVQRALASQMAPECGWRPNDLFDSLANFDFVRALLPFVTEVRSWMRMLIAFQIGVYIIPFMYRVILRHGGASRLVNSVFNLGPIVGGPSLIVLVFSVSYSWVDIQNWVLYFSLVSLALWLIWPVFRASVALAWSGRFRFQTSFDWVLQVFPECIPDPTEVPELDHPTIAHTQRLLRFLVFKEIRTAMAELVSNVDVYGGVADNPQTQCAYDAGLKLLERQQEREFIRQGLKTALTPTEAAGERIADFLYFAELYDMPNETKIALAADTAGGDLEYLGTRRRSMFTGSALAGSVLNNLAISSRKSIQRMASFVSSGTHKSGGTFGARAFTEPSNIPSEGVETNEVQTRAHEPRRVIPVAKSLPSAPSFMTINFDDLDE